MNRMKSVAGIGMLTAVFLIAYFVVLYLVGLADLIELRVFNFVILLLGIVIAIKNAKTKDSQFDYLRGIGVGFYVTLFAVTPFAAFVLLFLSFNTEFMQLLINHAPFGQFLTPWASAAVVFFEGLSSGVIITYSAMQYFKKNPKVVSKLVS